MSFAQSYSHWGMFPVGYYISVSDPIYPGISRAVYLRVDEEGNLLDDPWMTSPSVINSMARQYMGREK